MAVAVMAHPRVDERRLKGRAARERSPLSGHSGWEPLVTARIRWRSWRPRT